LQLTILKKVGWEISRGLELDLNNVSLSLRLEQQTYQVKPPNRKKLTKLDKQSRLLPEETQIQDVYNQSQQQLLILGEAGAGKTTILLELASHLLKLAKADNREPVPVLLNLSSWREDPDQSFVNWVVSELADKYSVPSDQVEEYLDQQQLLPLLDGLDEVEPKFQKACAKAINLWMIEKTPCGVVVCCRREEYERVATGNQLRLVQAIYLQALTQERITAYLESADLAAVDMAVQQDAELQKMLTKPLFLSVFAWAVKEEKIDLETWQEKTTSEERVRYLLDMYWQAATERKLIDDPKQEYNGILSKTYGKRKPPDPDEIKPSLIFIAKALNKNPKRSDDFLIERLQPYHLPQETQIRNYKIICRFFAVIAWIGVSLLSSYLYASNDFLTKVFLFILVTTGIPFVRYATDLDDIKAAEKIGLKSLVLSLFEVLAFSGFLGGISLPILAALQEFEIATKYFDLAIIIYTFAAGKFSSILVEYVFSNSRAEIDDSEEVNQGIKYSVSNTILFAFCMIIPSGMIGLNLFISFVKNMGEAGLYKALAFYVFYMFIISCVEGVRPLLQHVALRLVLWQNGYAPPRYDLLLDYCDERRLLRRIGGRYRFTHKLLQDYFAAMDLD
jgi:NACHT domain